MEHISQILPEAINNLQPKQNGLTADLSIKEIADLPVFVTPVEAERLGFTFASLAPNSINCEYCGYELKPIGRRAMLRREIIAWGKYQECQCKEAAKQRSKLILEAIEQKAEEEITIVRAEFTAKVEKLFKQSKLGDRFKNRTFETFKIVDNNKIAFETTKKYATDFNKYKSEGIGLNLNGTYGTGKTHLAAAIANSLINQGIPAVMGTTITLLGKFKEAYDRKESESEIIDLYSQVDLLVIDDLGKERVNDWVLEKLYLIINNRYENNLPIVITTNYSIDDLIKKLTTLDKYGNVINSDTAEAITSRLWEICRGVEMTGLDWRKK